MRLTELLWVLFLFTTALGAVVAAGLGLFLVVLADQVQTLRKRIAALEARGVAAPAAAPVAEVAAEPIPEAGEAPKSAPEAPKPAPPPRQPIELPSFERVAYWVGGAVGGFTLLLGLLLLVGVAIERGWIGPAARVALGLCAGTTLWIAGDLLRPRSWLPGAALSGAGVGALLGSFYAARALYGFLPVPVAFGAMILVCALATVIAARRDDRFLAHLALAGGLLTPVLLSTGQNAAVSFFAYLTVVVVGTLASASRRGWWDVVGLAAIGVTALHAGWAASWYTPDQAPVALVAAGALSLPFAVVAARTASTRVAVVAGLALCLVPCVALPWLIPVDAVFDDPRTGLRIVRPYAGQAAWAAAAAALLPVPGWLAARLRGTGVGALFASAVAAVLCGALVIGWATATEPPVAVLSASGLAQVALATILFVRAGRTGFGAALVPLAVGVGLGALYAAYPPSREVTLVAVLAFGALGAVGMRAATLEFLPATLAGLAAMLLGAALHVEDLGFEPIAGPALVVFTLLGTAPLLLRWDDARRPWATFAAGLAGPALYPAFHVAWEGSLGSSAIAVLPLVVGAHAALGALAVVRVHGARASDLSLALLVAVALFGVSAAIPLRLEEEALTITWALEAALLALLARRITHRLVPAAVIALGLTVSVRLLLNPAALAYGNADGWPILNWTLYTWGVPAVALGLAARWLPSGEDGWGRVERIGARLLGGCAILVGFALVNVEVSHAFQEAGPLELGGSGLFQGMTRSLAWGAYGFVWLVVGITRRSRGVRMVGFAFVLLATGKVYLVDLAMLEGIARVGSLIGLGVTLLVAAVLFDRLVLRDPRPSEEPS